MLDSLDTLIAFVLVMLVVSLLITIAVQGFAALLNLRGLNLLYGLRNTFSLIAPQTDQNVTDLARSILKGRLVSDSFLPNWGIFKFWRHATAIRPDEAFDSIHRIAIATKSFDEPALRESAQNLLVALGMDRQVLQTAAKQVLAAQHEINGFASDVDNVLQNIPDKNVRLKMQALANAAKVRSEAIRSEAVAAAEKTVATAADSIDKAYQRFHYWTDLCQERVQQWFTMHTRIITVTCAIFFAAVLQLDSVEIFKLVSSNKAVRDKLVAQAGAVQAQAARVFGESNSVLTTALKNWSEKETDPAIRTTLAGIKIENIDTRETVRDKVRDALGGKTPDNSFDSMVNAVATKELKKQSDDFNVVKASLDKTGFDLFPKGRGRWGKSWSDGWKHHVLGVLFSIGLLSLGAPFWYNLLKNLMSLRSTVAQNISKEQDQEQTQSDPNKPKVPPSPPPTLK
jgi:hypothetical protein